MKNNSNFLSSIKFKIVLLATIVAIICCAINIIISCTSANKNVKSLIADNMVSLVESYGAYLDYDIQNNGIEAALDPTSLDALLGDVVLEGMSTSYVYVVDNTGIMLYHPTPEKIGNAVENQAVKDVIAKLNAGNKPEPEFVSYLYKGAQKYAGYYVTKNSEAVIIITVDEKDALASVSSMRTSQIISSIVAFILSFAVAFVLASAIFKPLDRVCFYIDELANLRLIDNDELRRLSARKDETGRVAKAVSNVVSSIKLTVEDIIGVSDEISCAAKNLTHKMDDASNSIEQMEAAMGEIAIGVTNQAKSTEDTSDNIHMIVDKIGFTNESVDKLNNNANVMKKASNDAINTLEELVNTNKETVAAINDIYEQAKITNSSVNNIKEATELIASVADQTSLLSLNASIEAARAGEAGRGFAVVASEIQSLSNQTAESASKIAEIVNALITDSEREMSIMNQVIDIMKKQDDNVKRTNTVFSDVTRGIDSSIIGISSIAERTAEMDEASVKVIDAVGSLSAVAEQNAASSEETSASVTCITGVMEEMNDSFSELHRISEDLNEKIAIFKFQ